MIQFTYQPAFDPFHTIYRIFRVRERLSQIEIDKGRIVDFYLLFPFRMADVRFKRGDLSCRRTAQLYEERRGYAIQPASRALFEGMRPVYDAAAQTMAAEGYLDPACLLKGVLSNTAKPIPADLSDESPPTMATSKACSTA